MADHELTGAEAQDALSEAVSRVVAKRDPIEAPTQRAVLACGRWLSMCRRLGWSRDDLDGLEALWWKHHDHLGNLTSSKPEATS